MAHITDTHCVRVNLTFDLFSQSLWWIHLPIWNL